MKKRVLSVILGSSLALQLAPLAAFAQTTPVPEREEQRLKEDRALRDREDRKIRDLRIQEDRALKDRRIKEDQALKDRGLKEDRALRDREDRKMRDLRIKEDRALDEERGVKERRAKLEDELRAKRDDFRAHAGRREEELKRKLGERKGASIEEFFTRMVGKYENAIGRFNTSAERIEAGLNELESRGADVSDLRTQLTDARAKIIDVETALKDVREKYDQIAGADIEVKAKFAEVRALVRGLSAKVHAAHEALVKVIRATRGLGENLPRTTQ